MTVRVVNAIEAHGWNFTPLLIFGIGPKFNVLCGECKSWFSGRIQMSDNPRLRCLFCDTINILPLGIKT